MSEGDCRYRTPSIRPSSLPTYRHTFYVILYGSNRDAAILVRYRPRRSSRYRRGTRNYSTTLYLFEDRFLDEDSYFFLENYDLFYISIDILRPLLTTRVGRNQGSG